MLAEIIGKYINAKRIEKGLTIEALSSVSNSAESTVKSICHGNADNPQLKTMIPIMEAVGGSFDEMLYPDKHKDKMSDASVLALKDAYEYQVSVLKETNEAHITNIRAHYEQHREDVKENYERRLSDKREIIESYKEQVQILKKELNTSKIGLCICLVVFIAVLIAELMNPNLGWFRF